MKISFVIPAFNEEDRVVPCLQSVMRALASGAYDAEVILVNNASTDQTRERAATIAGVRVIDEPCKGLVRARDTGFRASDGQLIANIDADTILPPGWIETVLDEFRRDGRLAALSGPLIYLDLPVVTRGFIRVFYGLAYAAHLVMQCVFHVGAMIQGGNFVVRRSALEAIGGYNTAIDFYGEDTDIARRLSKKGRVKWTFRLPIYSSGRRLMEEGIVRVAARYALNFFWVTFFGRPWTKKHTDIRTK